MGLFAAAERFAFLEDKSVGMTVSRCLHSHDQNVECEACVSICPVDAILPGKPPTLDPEKCEHCLACLPACPVGAFHAKEFIPALLGCVARGEGNSVELMCGHNPNVEKTSDLQSLGLLLPDCLAALGSGTFLALAALGLEKVTLRLDFCEYCPWNSLQQAILNQVQMADQLLTPYGKDKVLQCIESAEQDRNESIIDVTNPSLTRRDLFRLAARQGQISMARAMELDMPGDTRVPGLDRMRLIGALEFLPDPVTPVDQSLDFGGFALIAVADSCTACSSCERACPTGAILFELEEVKKTFTLSFKPKLCIGCGICSDVCEPQSISINSAPPFSAIFNSEDPNPLHSGNFSRCEWCNTVFAAREGSKLCPVCEYRRKNPFGSHMPATMKKISGASLQEKAQ